MEERRVEEAREQDAVGLVSVGRALVTVWGWKRAVATPCFMRMYS